MLNMIWQSARIFNDSSIELKWNSSSKRAHIKPHLKCFYLHTSNEIPDYVFFFFLVGRMGGIIYFNIPTRCDSGCSEFNKCCNNTGPPTHKVFHHFSAQWEHAVSCKLRQVYHLSTIVQLFWILTSQSKFSHMLIHIHCVHYALIDVNIIKMIWLIQWTHIPTRQHPQSFSCTLKITEIAPMICILAPASRHL